MKYFLPELFIRGNSPDPAEAEAASDEWDAARKDYARALRAVKKHLPAQAARFVEELDLHDGEYIGLNVERADTRNFGLGHLNARVFVRAARSLVTLHYELDAEPDVRTGLLPPRLSTERPDWLYDEFCFDASTRSCSHEVFLSNGSVILFRFHGFDYAILPLQTLPGTQPAEGRSDSLVTA